MKLIRGTANACETTKDSIIRFMLASQKAHTYFDFFQPFNSILIEFTVRETKGAYIWTASLLFLLKSTPAKSSASPGRLELFFRHFTPLTACSFIAHVRCYFPILCSSTLTLEQKKDGLQSNNEQFVVYALD